jgi:hypothetical protein
MTTALTSYRCATPVFFSMQEHHLGVASYFCTNCCRGQTTWFALQDRVKTWGDRTLCLSKQYPWCHWNLDIADADSCWESTWVAVRLISHYRRDSKQICSTWTGAKAIKFLHADFKLDRRTFITGSGILRRQSKLSNPSRLVDVPTNNLCIVIVWIAFCSSLDTLNWRSLLFQSNTRPLFPKDHSSLNTEWIGDKESYKNRRLRSNHLKSCLLSK